MGYSRYRLEGNTRASEVETGLQARIGDALWLLARQWQVGEFRGEDAASPVQVHYQMETTPVTGFRSFHAKDYTAIDPFMPLEAYAEQQPGGDLAGFWRAAESGMHLFRLLSAKGLGNFRDSFRTNHPLKAPPRIEPTEQAWVRLLMRRACDGEDIYRKRNTAFAGIRGKLMGKQAAAFDEAKGAWERWHENRFSDQKALNCWDSERMEYRFQVRASTDAGAVVLAAKEYHGGHLDWYSFDVQADRTKPTSETKQHKSKTVLPAPVQFAGMAASRWWESEDGTVNFGDVNSSAVDFARMITAAFATGFGDDWFVIPLRIPIGSLAKIPTLAVRDSFGDLVRIDSMANIDGPSRVWRYFELKGDGPDPMLFVPAVALGRLEGTAVESVMLIRDETENLAWGIETTYEGALERAIERRRQWVTSRNGAETPSEGDLWTYRLLNSVPPHWIPFVPVRTKSNAQIRLRRGRMSEWELLPDDLVGIRGNTLLPNAAPLLIHEEEVPSSGIEITTSYQFARQVSGQSQVWLGRRKRPAKKITPITREVDAVLRSKNSHK